MEVGVRFCVFLDNWSQFIEYFGHQQQQQKSKLNEKFVSFILAIQFNCDFEMGFLRKCTILFPFPYYFLPLLCHSWRLFVCSGVTMVGGTVAIKNPINQKFKICPNFNNKIKEKHCRSSLLCYLYCWQHTELPRQSELTLFYVFILIFSQRITITAICTWKM